MAAGAAFSNAALIYDDFTGITSYTTTGSNPGFLLADGANSIASAGAGNHWEITSIDFGMFFIGAQSYTAGQLVAQIKVFSTYTDDGVNPVFTNQVATVNYALGAISSTGNAAFGVTGGALTPIVLPDTANTLGWTVGFFDANTGGRIGTVRAAMTTTVAPMVGTSSNGFYRDVNDDGTIAPTGEKFIFNAANASDNMIIRFNGNSVASVPEPASMAIIGLGLVGLVSRRRRK